jgi:hypothetical protein
MRRRYRSALLLFLMLGSALPTSAQNPCVEEKRSLQKVSLNDTYTWFTINNLFNWYGNNGNSSYNITAGIGGLEFPKGSGKQAVFEDGVVWGGFHKGRTLPKVGGSTYRSGLQAGRITAYGGPTDSAYDRPTADDPALPKYRVYRVRPDITPGTSDSAAHAAADTEAALIGRYRSMTAQQVLDQYVADWNEWPAKDGLPAPYTDVNNDGVYDPAVDIPGQPGADQTLYYVANDLSVSRVTNLYASPPIGLEMHRTVWGYNKGGALGNTICASTLIINKSGAPVDSMFLVQWSDPDLGDAGDDFAGCDVARSLGFVYNGHASDSYYGTAVPAVGYALLQGPMIRTGNPRDSAIFRTSTRQGFRNREMTSYAVGVCASIQYSCSPGTGIQGGDVQWYRIMNGRIATTDGQNIDPTTGQPSVFVLNGDPVTRKGWIDGTSGLVPGDRSLALSTGPFTLANGDTQEIVVATIVGDGADRLTSVTMLKRNRDIVKMLHAGLMEVPLPPPAPEVAAGLLDQEITLSWTDSIGATKIEAWRSAGYAFEGYNVYQLRTSSPDLAGAARLATFDVVNSLTTVFDDVFDPESGYLINKPVQFGTDSGIKRWFRTREDAIGGKPLASGSAYYFGVTSYSVNVLQGLLVKQIESTPRVLTVVPQSPVPGTAYHTMAGASLAVTHAAGVSTAAGYAAVIDPTRVAGKNYEVRIVVTDSVMNPDLGIMVPNPKWAVYDAATNQALSRLSADFTFSNSSPIVDGVQFSLSGSPFYVAGKELGSLTWTPAAHFNLSAVNETPYPGDAFINSLLTAEQVAQDVEMEFTAAGQGQKAYDFVRTATSGSGGSVYEGYYEQPFRAYELNPDGSRKRQIDFLFMEDNTRAAYDRLWAPGATSADREYWFFVTEQYSPEPKAKYVAGTTTLNDALLADSCVWSGWYILTSGAKPAYSPGDVWTITTTKIVTAADRWIASTVGLAPTTGDRSLAIAGLGRVNVFPNPYIGFNPRESDKYQRFVTFTHLPERATIRIFTLAGVLIRTLVKNEPGQFFRWDLLNENRYRVGAGMYIVHVEMPDLGRARVLKLGIIHEQQFVDHW